MENLTKKSKNDTQNPKVTGEKSQARIDFERWANDLREASAVRQKALGKGGNGGGAWWWRGLPADFRRFLLSTLAGDDWQCFELAEWGGLPDGLRSAISRECRALSRVVVGCPWR